MQSSMRTISLLLASLLCACGTKLAKLTTEELSGVKMHGNSTNVRPFDDKILVSGERIVQIAGMDEGDKVFVAMSACTDHQGHIWIDITGHGIAGSWGTLEKRHDGFWFDPTRIPAMLSIPEDDCPRSKTFVQAHIVGYQGAKTVTAKDNVCVGKDCPK